MDARRRERIGASGPGHRPTRARRAVVDRQRTPAAEPRRRRRRGGHARLLALRRRRRGRERRPLVQRRRRPPGHQATTRPHRAAARGSRRWRTTRRTTTPLRSAWRCACSPPRRPAARPVFRCEIGARGGRHLRLGEPLPSRPDGARIAWAESDGIHVAAVGALDDCAAIREQVVTLPGAWEPGTWTPATDPAPEGGTRRATPSLTLAVRTRKRPHRLTLRKRGVRARITVSAPTTVHLTLRGGGAKNSPRHAQAHERGHDHDPPQAARGRGGQGQAPDAAGERRRSPCR